MVIARTLKDFGHGYVRQYFPSCLYFKRTMSKSVLNMMRHLLLNSMPVQTLLSYLEAALDFLKLILTS